VDQFDIGHGTLEDVIRVFGEPAKYRLGYETLDVANLPDSFCLDYENGFAVWFQNRRLEELRIEDSGLDYAYEGKLHVGSSLEEALAVVGPPDQTVEGQANGWENGVLYKDIGGQKGQGYYQRAERGIRMFFAGNKVAALYLTRRDTGTTHNPEEDSAPKPMLGEDVTEKVAKFNIDNASLNDVVSTFGEPLEYCWGSEKYDKDRLPDNFCMEYPDKFVVHMQNGAVQELRFHQPNFTLAGKLKVGSPLKEVIEFLGKPEQTVEGKANGWETGILYKDISGRKGQ